MFMHSPNFAVTHQSFQQANIVPRTKNTLFKVLATHTAPTKLAFTAYLTLREHSPFERSVFAVE